MTEATKLTMVKEYWKHADEGLRNEFAAMQTGFSFYAGHQWSAKDLAKLEREGRPALTINLILPIINLLSGIQRQGKLKGYGTFFGNNEPLTTSAIRTIPLKSCPQGYLNS
jgi:hypothetical protein